MLLDPAINDDLVSYAGEDGMVFEGPHGGLASRGVAERLEVPWTTSLADALAPVRELADRSTNGVVFLRLPFDREPIVAVSPAELVRGKTAEVVPWSTQQELRVEAVPTEDRWAAAVADAIAAINEGRAEKVVLARQLQVTAAQPFSAVTLLRRLQARYPRAYRYSMDGFLGASPELLIAKVENEVRSVPMAGTIARGTSTESDARLREHLRTSAKDQHEHRVLADKLGADLALFCSTLRVPSTPDVVTLANVHHLASPIFGILADPRTHILDVLAAIHPTPAIAGLPTTAALELIRELEPTPRGPYGGAIGWFDREGNGTFALALRGALVQGATARLYAGAGIVAESDPAAEVSETAAKFRVMLDALAG